MADSGDNNGPKWPGSGVDRKDRPGVRRDIRDSGHATDPLGDGVVTDEYSAVPDVLDGAPTEAHVMPLLEDEQTRVDRRVRVSAIPARLRAKEQSPLPGMQYTGVPRASRGPASMTPVSRAPASLPPTSLPPASLPPASLPPASLPPASRAPMYPSEMPPPGYAGEMPPPGYAGEISPPGYAGEISPPGYAGEISIDALDPLLDEALDYDDAPTPKPAMPVQGHDARSAKGKHKPALPLPAPPSKTGRHRVSPHVTAHVASGASRPDAPERMTLAGTSRSKRHPAPFLGHKGRVPELVDEDDERSTAVSAQPLSALRKPLVGGKYHIVQRIGAGGMGKVFKVTHSQLGKTFALKIISDNLADDDKVRELFYREARMASSLSHPNIATVVDFGEDENLGAFMVMELLEGEALNKVIYREKRLGIRTAADITRQLAEALSYIHSKGIVHCDLKTENILLVELPGGGPRKQKQVKLLDFGLAKNITGGRQTGSLAGTPHYVAPERIRGEQPAPSTDIYGLGILFYEMLTGKVPWDGNVDQILHGHLHKQPLPPSRLIDGGLDPAVEKLVLRALAKTPKERHKSMDAFLYELKTVMDMLGYGRRGKRRTAKKVLSKPSSQRDDWAKSLFDASRVPMALISREGVILVANTAFAQFIMGVTVAVEGMDVSNTPLVNAWATFDTDLSRACSGTSMRRTIELDIDPNTVRRLLMWLDPGLSKDQAIFGVHPLDG